MTDNNSMNAIAVIILVAAAIASFGAHLKVHHGAQLGRWASTELAVGLIAVGLIVAAIFSGHWVWHVN